jgi:membrane associated rhomboid family serine protease
MPSFYLIFVLTWLVASFCMGMFGFAILPDDIPRNLEMWIAVAMNLIPILVGYLCASHMTKRKIRDLEEIQAAFPVILKDVENQPKNPS